MSLEANYTNVRNLDPDFHYKEIEKMEIKMEKTEIETDTHIEKDALGIWKHMHHTLQLVSHKRLFLMGLSTREGFDRNATSYSGNQSALPESFLRKDDLFYDDVKVLVERCFDGCNVDDQQCTIPTDVQIIGLRNMPRSILALLDDFSNNGLYNLAKLLTRGLITIVKTRPQMKRVIKTSLLAIQSKQYPVDYQVRLQNELSQLLKSPKNFRSNYRKHVNFTLKSHRVDIMKVLNGLEDMKLQTLRSMCRKLKGIKTKSPLLHNRPSRRPKELLIKQVRKMSLDMIQQLGDSDELQEPLMKAMTVAALSLNMVSGSEDLSVLKFLRVAPGIKTLQDEILRAIKLLDQRIRKEEMKKLGHLLDPDFKAQGKSLKSAIRNMLTEFLFECVDMDVVPDSLLGALSLINKKSTPSACGTLSKDLINDDVECILNLSAYLKQLFWVSYPINQLDQDFVDAYMDEAEESDDGDIFDDSDDDQKLQANSTGEFQIRFNDWSEEVGSTSCINDACSVSPSSTREANLKDINDFGFSKLADDVCSDTEICQGEMLISTVARNNSSPLISPGLVDGQDFYRNTTNSSNTDDNDNCSKQNMSGYERNGYVTIQEVCDNASIVAYELIGHALSKFAQLEALGLDQNEEAYLRGGISRPGHFEDPVANSRDKDVSGSILIEAVHKVLPSFSKRRLQ
ncbi:hypothetical protein RND81_14G179100 [Saponaria officinalis]|uniref:Uncharacterized protein n=1 Tax=Saponaria officinalis TaxID=3572 RepID=A0AAW1GTK2_SAPOF